MDNTEKKRLSTGRIIALIALAAVIVLAVIFGAKALNKKNTAPEPTPAPPVSETEAPAEQPAAQDARPEEPAPEQTPEPAPTDAPADEQPDENQGAVLLEDGGDVVIVLPDGMDSAGF